MQGVCREVWLAVTFGAPACLPAVCLPVMSHYHFQALPVHCFLFGVGSTVVICSFCLVIGMGEGGWGRAGGGIRQRHAKGKGRVAWYKGGKGRCARAGGDKAGGGMGRQCVCKGPVKVLFHPGQGRGGGGRWQAGKGRHGEGQVGNKRGPATPAGSRQAPVPSLSPVLQVLPSTVLSLSLSCPDCLVCLFVELFVLSLGSLPCLSVVCLVLVVFVVIIVYSGRSGGARSPAHHLPTTFYPSPPPLKPVACLFVGCLFGSERFQRQ